MLIAKQIAVAVEQSRSINDYVKKNEVGKTENDPSFEGMLDMTSPEKMVSESLSSNPHLLEVMGFFPDEPHDRPSILFGSYEYASDTSLFEEAREVADRGASLLKDTKINGKRVLESYIPIQPDNQRPYMIRIISSYEPISAAITKQLINEIAISIVLLQIVVFSSYILAGELIRPVQNILYKVNRLSSGDFRARIEVKRQDELGVLGRQINMMADNMGHYTEELQLKNNENQAIKERLESIINQMADAIHVTDLSGEILEVNKAFEQLYGWNSDEIVGVKLDFVPHSYLGEREGWLKELKDGRPYVLAETVRLCKDGRQINVSISISPILDEDGEIVSLISISRDMTEHNKMEELLRRAEKLRTVGQLAAGVAHEIRNPLTTLRGFLQLQQRAHTVNDTHTDIMLSELERINMIVSEFLILAKPQAVQFEIKDVRYTVGDVISLLDSEAHLHNIEFEHHFSTSPLLVHCEENQLKQVFINVLKNAMEAMPGGGRIILQVGNHGEHHVAIRFIDEGEGISQERLDKLGEPFYTSKEKGTGLGLMISQRIIEGHKGLFEIESKLGKGTTVTITLPRSIEAQGEVVTSTTGEIA
jgi:PAS domain S-box-containing protein